MDESFISDFIDYQKAIKNLSQNTIKAYKTDILQFLRFLKSEGLSNPVLIDVTHLNIRSFLAYLRSKDISKRTIARKLSTIRIFYRYLAAEGLVHENVAKAVNSPKLPKKLPLFLYPEEIEKLFSIPKSDKFGIRDKAIMELLYATGMRVGELVSLKIQDINFGPNYIVVFGKGSKERVVFFGRKAAESLEEYLKKADLF